MEQLRKQLSGLLTTTSLLPLLMGLHLFHYRVDRARIPCVSAWTKEIAKLVERDPEHRTLKTA